MSHKNIIQIIISNYLAGQSSNKIAKELSISTKTVTKVLRQNNIDIRNLGVRYLKQSDITYIINEYENGVSSKELGKKFKVSNTTIILLIRDNGGKIRKAGNQKGQKLGTEAIKGEETINELLFLYSKGESITNLAKKYEVCLETINTLLRNRNVKSARQKRAPLLPCNRDYFKCIDSEEKAYWLGFIAADGHVRKESLIINLSKKDEEHLNLFKKCIQSSHRISNIVVEKEGIIKKCGVKEKYFKVRLTIPSVKLAKDLMRLGFDSNKTNSLNFPQLSFELTRHFIRGYVDGDGWWSKGTLKNEFGIVSTYSFCQSVLDILKTDCKLNTKAKVHNVTGVNVSRFRISGKSDLDKIYHYLYSSSTIYLKRKFEMAFLIHNDLEQFKRLFPENVTKVNFE